MKGGAGKWGKVKDQVFKFKFYFPPKWFISDEENKNQLDILI